MRKEKHRELKFTTMICVFFASHFSILISPRAPNEIFPDFFPPASCRDYVGLVRGEKKNWI